MTFSSAHLYGVTSVFMLTAVRCCDVCSWQLSAVSGGENHEQGGDTMSGVCSCAEEEARNERNQLPGK